MGLEMLTHINGHPAPFCGIKNLPLKCVAGETLDIL